MMENRFVAQDARLSIPSFEKTISAIIIQFNRPPAFLKKILRARDTPTLMIRV